MPDVAADRLCRYYKSPSCAKDIKRLGRAMAHVSTAVRTERIQQWAIFGDFNLHNEDWSLSHQGISPNARAEYDEICTIMDKYHLQLLNRRGAVTREAQRCATTCSAVLDLALASDRLTALGVKWERLILGGSDHIQILISFGCPAQRDAVAANDVPTERS